MFVGDVIISDERSSGAEDGARHNASKAQSGVFGILILMVSELVRFVDDDEAEILDGRKESGAWTNYDTWMIALQSVFPDAVTDGFGLCGMKQNDIIEVIPKINYELRSEGDFGHEQDKRFVLCESLTGELDVNISFAAAGDAVQKNGVGGAGVNFGDGALLSGIERVVGMFARVMRRGSISATIFSDAARQNSLNDGRHWATIIVGEPSKGCEELRW